MQLNLQNDRLDVVFPFHFALDESMVVQAAGKGIKKLIPDILGSHFTDVLRFKRPAISIKANYASLCEYVSQVFIVEQAKDEEGVQFRGQMLIVENGILFVGSPWMTSVEDLDKHGLLLTDFAIHDPVTDLLQVIKVRELATGDVELQRDQLRAKNKEIADLAKFPSENPNPIFRIALSGTIRYANKASEVLKESWGLEVGGSFPKVIKTLFHACIESGEQVEGEADAGPRSYWLQLTPFVDDGYVNVYASDITERKQMEQTLQESKEKAEELLHMKERFLANMSHEIRTPMNGILGMTRLLESAKLDEKHRGHLTAIQSSANNLLVIINDILDLSKIESGNLELEEIVFHPRKVIEEVINSVDYLASQKDLYVATELNGVTDQTHLMGDPVRLGQVLTNLMSNAIKFTDTGKVKLSLTVSSDKPGICQTRFDVEDTGVGIPPEKVETIFESFKQADSSTTRKYGGTGLGLSICRQLVELQGGTISVASEVGKGSCFSFSIPFAMGEKEAVATPVEEEQSGDIGGVRVLLVEDHKINQVYAASILENNGAVVELAENGQEAVDMVADGQYDIVLMDMQMPIMGGVEATQIIRKQLKLTLPIIALTANALKGDSDRYLKEGMNEYISKPFKDTELIQKIFELVRGEDTTHQTDEQDSAVDASPLYSLKKLQDMSRGNADFVDKMVGLFLEETPKSLEALANHLKENNVEGIASVVHKMKPSIAMMDIVKLENKMPLIEQYARENKHLDQLAAMVEELIQCCYTVLEQLESTNR